MTSTEPHRDARPLALRSVRVLQILVSVSLAVAVFGGVVPFVLLAARMVPSHGLANIVYLMAGGAVGLVVGGLGAYLTLRGDAWMPRRFVLWVLPLALVVLVALAAARWFDAFAHV